MNLKSNTYYRSAHGSVFHFSEVEEFQHRAGFAAKCADYAISPNEPAFYSQGFGVYHISYEMCCGLKEITEDEFVDAWVSLVKSHLETIPTTDYAFSLNFKGTKERSLVLRAAAGAWLRKGDRK